MLRSAKMLAIVVVLLSISTLVVSNNFVYQFTPTKIMENVQYNFYAHCPAYYHLKSLGSTDIMPDGAVAKDWVQTHKDELMKTFIIPVMGGKALTTDTTAPEAPRVRYCGWVRTWAGTCENGFALCSNPGPALDVNTNEQITVVWINNVTQSAQFVERLVRFKSLSENLCYDQDVSKHLDLCGKDARSCPWEDKTYFDTTSKGTPKMSVNIAKTGIHTHPISPHIHGLDVRPAFDGNPQSWFDNMGNEGIGFFSAEESNYFKAVNSEFQHPILSNAKIFEKNYKINIYENNQQPGTLWYHDHAMGNTGFNVRIGLHAFYPLRDKTVEAGLPSGDFEKLLYMYGSSHFGKGSDTPSYELDCTSECADVGSQTCTTCLESGTPTVVPAPTLEKGSTYRMKVIDGDAIIEYTALQFVYNSAAVGSPPTYVNIPFKVIGSDSTLRKTPVDAVEKVFLSNAERVEILINFDTVTSDTVFVLSDDGDLTDTSVFDSLRLSQFSVAAGSTGGVKDVATLDVPYISLRELADDKITVKRNIVLTWDFPQEEPGEFGMDGHVRMHAGDSYNPKLGTTEDWIFMNTMVFGHPMHIHLIQFQTMQYGDLRLHNDDINCTYYLIKFFQNHAASKGLAGDYDTADKACAKINELEGEAYMDFFHDLKIGQTVVNKIAGLDVFTTCNFTNSQCANDYGYTAAEDTRCTWKPTDTTLRYAFVCNDITDSWLHQYNKGWKETVWVPGHSFGTVRIRFAQTTFPVELMEAGKEAEACAHGYYPQAEEALTEFPGFVVHCHILLHEDREMMRSFMVQPSDCNHIGRWEDRYLQINRAITNNKKTV